MYTPALFAALVGITFAMPLDERQASSGALVDLPIALGSKLQNSASSIQCTAETVGTHGIFHLGELTVPAFQVESAQLIAGFDVAVVSHIGNATVSFPLKIKYRKDKAAARMLKRQQPVIMGPFTLPPLDVDFDDVKQAQWDLVSKVGDIRIDRPAVSLNKRQLNFWDEFIDIGIEIGNIFVNIGNTNNGGVVPRETDIILFNGAVILADVKVDVALAWGLINIPVIG